MIEFFQAISTKITAFITVAMIAVASILPGATNNINKPTATNTATPSATVSESASPSPSLTPTPAPKVKAKVENTPAPTPAPVIIEAQPTVLPQIKEAQKQKVDSAVGIEQCRAYTKEKKLVEEKRLNEIYSRITPEAWEFATSQNNGQTQVIALKYGIITQAYIDKVLGTYDQARKEGNAVEIAGQRAKEALSDYSAYLRSLHDWGANEVKRMNAILKDTLDTYENQVYQACLSIL